MPIADVEVPDLSGPDGLSFGTDGSGNPTFNVRVANPVPGVYYTAFVADTLAGPFLADAASRLAEPDAETLLFALAAGDDRPSRFVRIVASTDPFAAGDPLPCPPAPADNLPRETARDRSDPFPSPPTHARLPLHARLFPQYRHPVPDPAADCRDFSVIGDPGIESLSETTVVSTVAAAMGTSRRQADRRFQATGKTIRERIEETRLSRACHLLRSTSMTQRDVAAECGFASATYFSRLFRRRFGSTPGTWRVAGLPSDRRSPAVVSLSRGAR